MPTVYIIISFFLLGNAWGTARWVQAGEAYLQGSPKAQEELHRIADLDAILKREIETGGDQAPLSLELIRKLDRQGLVPFLKTKVVDFEKGDVFLRTLVSMSTMAKTNELLEYINSKVDLLSSRTTGALKMMVLFANDARNQELPPKVMLGLLDDPSFNVQLKSIDLPIPATVQSQYLRKALSSKLATLRHKTVNHIKALSPTDQKTYLSELKKCAHVDQDPQVKILCAEVSSKIK